ncbi:MAG: dihydrolipoamide acetyltransferase family protein [Candidatus Velthaea sp.]
MPTTITMPQLGETVTEGTVAQWLKKVGDTVEKYEAFVEVSTDKVNAEVPAPVSGTIRELIVKEGETVATGAPIAIIDEIGALVAPAPSEQVAGGHTAAARAEASHQGSDEPVFGGNVGAAKTAEYTASASSSNGNGRRSNGTSTSGELLRSASPAVRRLAREHNIDVSAIHGSGTHGRITARDIMAAASAGPSAAAATAISAQGAEFLAAPDPSAVSGRPTYANPIPGELIPLTQARKIIAQRTLESRRSAPHAWTMVEIDVTNVWKWRAREKDAFEKTYGMKLTLLPFFLRAAVESLSAFPLMNASFSDEGILVHKNVNVGMAVATGGNLLVPVIKGADRLSIKGLALAAGEIIDKARRGKLGADDLSGGTFTVNNTGANGSILSQPILVNGQTGNLTMEAVVKRPVVRDDDAIVVRSMMNACLSLDHRVVDGAVASGFLADLKKRLEAMGPAGTL